MKGIVHGLMLWVAAMLGTAYGVELMHPEEIKSGMKGYGYSVFKGTEPERFEVEVLGVLKNTFPRQDMILIRMSGGDLEKHKVIAGMSGSPIYVDEKLIGALAYGWMFENEPLAGVTPIRNMLSELNRPVVELSGSGAAALAKDGEGLFAWPELAAPRVTAGMVTPQRLLTPLSLAGFDARVIGALSSEWERMGLMPVAAGGSSAQTNAQGGGPDQGDAAAKLRPGSALGVALIRGDLSALAVGTVTHIEGQRVLAFGHPFFGGGNTRAPAMLAEVHAIMSSMARSFKMSTGVRDVGAMVGDWQSCIVADTGIKATMMPVTITVNNRDTGHRERYDIEVMRNQALTPLLVLASIVQGVSAATGASQDVTVHISVQVKVAASDGVTARVMEVTDTHFSSTGILLNPRPVTGLLRMFNTPYGNPSIERVEVTINARLNRQTAEIKRAYFSKAELKRGEVAPLTVVLKPFDGPEVRRTVNIRVPAGRDEMKQMVVMVVDGASAPADVAPPDNLNDYLDVIQRQYRATDLVVLTPSPMLGMPLRGRMLRQLPPSVLGVLEDSSVSGGAPSPEVAHYVDPTEWVLSGRAVVRVSLRDE